MTLFITVLHVLVCLVLIVVVLLQRGKGAEIGAVFGGGGGNTVFGARGAGNFLTRLTTASAVIFMLTSFTLAYFGREAAESTLFEEEGTEQASPAAAFQPVEEQPKAGATTESGGFEEVAPPPPNAGSEANAAEDAEAPSPTPAAEPDSAPRGPGGAPAGP